MSIESIQRWFTAAVPNPDDRNRAVQIGCHIEEVAEMAAAINDDDLAAKLDVISGQYKGQYKTEADIRLCSHMVVDRLELLDALCDQIVTAIGVAHMFGLDISTALARVDKSNWSKFDDQGRPIFNEHGKIAKGPNYVKADLSDLV